MKYKHRYWKIKYIYERIISLIALILILPLLTFIALLQKIFNPFSPIFYSCKRLGMNGKVFRLYKFRTMIVNAPELRSLDNKLITYTNDNRVTFFGRFLRLGFDELPQLINVLKGDMCLIGPRPDIPEEYYNYNKRQMIRITVLPGITGLTQVLDGRSLHNLDNYELDVRYVLQSKFSLDIKIILLTLPYSLGLKKIGQKYLYKFMFDLPHENKETI